MATVILIKNNDLAKLSNMGGNIDPDRYWYAVRDAQKTILKPLLGKELYDKICSDFSGGTLTDAYKELYDDYILDIVVHHAASLYLAAGAYQITNAGITKASPDNTETVSKSEVDYMVFHQRNLGKDYERQMLKHLKDNKESYPEYDCGCGKHVDNHYGWLLTPIKRYRGY